jgi:hypothetical protein
VDGKEIGIMKRTCLVANTSNMPVAGALCVLSVCEREVQLLPRFPTCVASVAVAVAVPVAVAVRVAVGVSACALLCVVAAVQPERRLFTRASRSPSTSATWVCTSR